VTGLTSEELAAWCAYKGAHERLLSCLARELSQATGLSEADFQVLEAFAQRSTTRMRALELRCALQWEKSRLSHQIRRMEQRGLLARAACSEDNRAADVVLTQAGRHATTRALAVRVASVRRYVVDQVGAERLRMLAEVAALLDEGLRGRCEPG
jgi:DNA-binding MarR family transcriptional regulator